MGYNLRFLSAEDVRRALPMTEAITVMKEAFIQLSEKRAVVPVRVNIDADSEHGRALFMPVYLPDARQLGLKIAAVKDNNPRRGLPLIHAIVLVVDMSTGRPAAVMDGEYLTELRTGAASGLATDLLARKDAHTLAIFGTGAQARTQIEGVCSVRDIQKVIVFGRTRENTETFVKEVAKRLSISVEKAEEPKKLKDADIICTATTSATPVFEHQNLKTGVHINGIGSYRPHTREIPGETIAAAVIVVDERTACLAEAGDLIQPIQEGRISEAHIYAEIGEIASGSKSGRTSESEITVFKSVGNAVQDLAAAGRILRNAERMSLGIEVTL